MDVEPVREPWVTFSLAREAVVAAADDEVWALYLSGLRAVLDASSHWTILIEADCDQHSLARSELTTHEVVERLDEQRRLRSSSLAMIVSKRCE